MLVNIIGKFSLHNPLYVRDTAGHETAARLAGCDFAHAAYGFGSTVNRSMSFNSFSELREILRR
jgi:hypothetical protein